MRSPLEVIGRNHLRLRLFFLSEENYLRGGLMRVRTNAIWPQGVCDWESRKFTFKRLTSRFKRLDEGIGIFWQCQERQMPKSGLNRSWIVWIFFWHPRKNCGLQGFVSSIFSVKKTATISFILLWSRPTPLDYIAPRINQGAVQLLPTGGLVESPANFSLYLIIIGSRGTRPSRHDVSINFLWDHSY